MKISQKIAEKPKTCYNSETQQDISFYPMILRKRKKEDGNWRKEKTMIIAFPYSFEGKKVSEHLIGEGDIVIHSARGEELLQTSTLSAH